MATSKDKHYWIQLRIALTGGLWDSHSPGKAPNAAPLSWSELLRKFKKHCSASSDFAELASQTQALSLLLAANASDQSLDGNDVGSNCPLELGRECLLDEERISEANLGYNTLKGLDTSNTEVRVNRVVVRPPDTTSSSLFVSPWLTTPTLLVTPRNVYLHYNNRRI